MKNRTQQEIGIKKRFCLCLKMMKFYLGITGKGLFVSMSCVGRSGKTRGWVLMKFGTQVFGRKISAVFVNGRNC